jgi:formylglycine-generating enzyme required for sulfatase activity
VTEDRLNLVGVTLEGKYRIDAVVAEGGFALVYKATHLVWNRPVAVKVFYALADLPESQRASLVEEFLREGALLAELSERSAAIVQARDVGTTKTPDGEQLPFMILEWLDGTTLENVLRAERDKGLPLRTPAEAVDLLDPVAEALALAHRRGIAHRDVKPPNIFVIGDPRAPKCGVKLLDFGIAKVVQDVQKAAGSFSKTSGNVTSFTPAYGAPEQFSRTHGATGPWTDVFALALVASEVMSGCEPLSGDTFVQLGFASSDASRRPTPRTLGCGSVTEDVERVFAKALAVRPEDRYQDAGDFWSALRAALAMTPMELSQKELPATSTKPRADTAAFAATAIAPDSSAAPPTTTTKSRSPLLYVIGAVAAIGIVAGVAVALKGPPPIPAIPSASATMKPMASASAGPPMQCPQGAVFVPGGPFFMGSNDTSADNEKPAHPVTLTPYCIDRFEVTTAAFFACSKIGKCLRASLVNVPKLAAPYDSICNANAPDARAQNPINCVNWDQAQKYCMVQGGRLPTEAEWELAARGQDGRLYPWGDDVPSPMRANGCGSECIAWAKEQALPKLHAMYETSDGFATTAPVGSFPQGKSQYGVEDLVGNVGEWTADFYDAYTKDVATTKTDPKGPADGSDRVVRGGAWNAEYADWARPTFRYFAAQTNQSHGIGFRCVYPAASSAPPKP